MSSANSDSFTTSFPFVSFYSIYFPCMITVARTSNIMLYKSGEIGQLCLVPDLRGKAFSFSVLDIMLVVVCRIWPLLCSLYTHFVFIANGC